MTAYDLDSLSHRVDMFLKTKSSIDISIAKHAVVFTVSARADKSREVTRTRARDTL